MKNKLFAILSLVLCILLCATCVGCSDEKNGEESETSEKEQAFEPVKDTGELSELYTEYTNYKNNAPLAFKSNSPVSADALEYEDVEGGIAITKYIGSEDIVVLPEEIDEKPIIKICTGVFSGAILRAVYIPDSVKSIEKGAFDSCEGLSTLRLPVIGDGVENAFLGYMFGASAPDENAVCVPPSLKMVILGDNIDMIADDAFWGCKTVSSVILPDSVKSIGSAAFYECEGLVYISVGNQVEGIGEYAFAYCRKLYSIDISTAKTVGDGILFSCTSINNIKINPSDSDFLGRLFGAEKPEYNADFVSESLRRVEIAEGCLMVPDRMFSSCKYITEVLLPESLESVGTRAFYACRSLAAIKMTSVKTVSDDAFFGCDNLFEVELGESLANLGMQAFFGCGALKSVSLPGTLKEIKPSTFYTCSSLVTVELGGVKKIGKDAFYGCVRLAPVSGTGIEIAEGNEALVPSTEE